jgi:anti-sigma regulatory factor (Ser/Thr protein kinase)
MNRCRPDSRTALPAVTAWITEASLEHGASLAAHLMQRLAIGRSSATALLRRLVAAQWLQRSGPRHRPVYRPGALRQVVRTYALAGLQEDRPWRVDIAPCLELPPAVRRMAQHACTELLNNAVDHSGGNRVTLSVRQTPLHLQMLVSDDGCGVFDRIEQAFAIDEPRLAMFELSKGKLSSDPLRHRGHGLYFTAQLADIFDLHANGVAFQRRTGTDAVAGRWRDTRSLARAGSSIYWAVALDTPRTLASVLEAHSGGRPGCPFELTRVPLHLLADGGVLASRAEARRVAARLVEFRGALLDFCGVRELGQAFADELFRVCPQDQPRLRIEPVGMSPAVAATVAAARQLGG